MVFIKKEKCMVFVLDKIQSTINVLNLQSEVMAQ